MSMEKHFASGVRNHRYMPWLESTTIRRAFGPVTTIGRLPNGRFRANPQTRRPRIPSSLLAKDPGADVRAQAIERGLGPLDGLVALLHPRSSGSPGRLAPPVLRPTRGQPHRRGLVLVPEVDAPLRQIVGRQLEADPVPRENGDSMLH